MSVTELLEFTDNLKLTGREELIGSQILKEIHDRLGFLKDVGAWVFNPFAFVRYPVRRRKPENTTGNPNRVVAYGSAVYSG